MKKLIFTISIAMLFGIINVQAQDTMYVYQKTGGVENNEDSEVFYAKTTTPVEGTVTDKDGNVYSTITIGTQTWMKENLKVTKYNNGTAIPLVTDATAWGALKTPGYCWPNNDQTTYGNTYGALYNWYTINTANLCPTGWHVPTDAEWTTLTNYLGGEGVAGSGGKLKETGTTYWLSPNKGATNETGFTALPGGSRYFDGVYGGIGNDGFWWSATEYSTNTAWHRSLGFNYSFVSRSNYDKQSAISVRCLRDQ